MNDYSTLSKRLGDKDLDAIFIRCNCNDIRHLMVIVTDRLYTKDKKSPEYYDIAIMGSDQGSLWGRIKYAIRYIINGPFTDQIVLNKKQVISLVKTLTLSLRDRRNLK